MGVPIATWLQTDKEQTKIGLGVFTASIPFPKIGKNINHGIITVINPKISPS